MIVWCMSQGDQSAGAAAGLVSKQGIPEQACWGPTPPLTQPLTKWFDVLEVSLSRWPARGL